MRLTSLYQNSTSRLTGKNGKERLSWTFSVNDFCVQRCRQDTFDGGLLKESFTVSVSWHICGLLNILAGYSS